MGADDPDVEGDREDDRLADLSRGDVPMNELVITQRSSKSLEEYTQSTRATAALERAAELGYDRYPGENVRYVVVDDEKDSMDRVRLAIESGDDYDPAFYEELAVRACESIVSPLGWRRGDIEDYLSETAEVRLSAF